MPKLRLKYLFGLYLRQKISYGDYAELMHLIADPGNKDEVTAIIEKAMAQATPCKRMKEAVSSKILGNIFTGKQILYI